MPAPGEVITHFVGPAADGPLANGAEFQPAPPVPNAAPTGPPGGTRLAVLCDPSLVFDGGAHRGTGVSWAVRCPKCRELLAARGEPLERPAGLAGGVPAKR